MLHESDAVSYLLQPVEAKPTALKKTMETMGVRGLTIQNIKSHLQVPLPVSDSSIIFFRPCTISIHFFFIYVIFLVCQRYREKCELGAEAPAVEVPGTTSLCKEALNQYDFLSNKILVFPHAMSGCFTVCSKTCSDVQGV